jgi:hypothetical protein
MGRLIAAPLRIPSMDAAIPTSLELVEDSRIYMSESAQTAVKRQMQTKNFMEYWIKRDEKKSQYFFETESYKAESQS